MNLFKFLKEKPVAILWFLVVIIMCLGFNSDMFSSAEHIFFGTLFDFIVPFASGCGIAYQYATWYFNKDN